MKTNSIIERTNVMTMRLNRVSFSSPCIYVLEKSITLAAINLTVAAIRTPWLSIIRGMVKELPPRFVISHSIK